MCNYTELWCTSLLGVMSFICSPSVMCTEAQPIQLLQQQARDVSHHQHPYPHLVRAASAVARSGSIDLELDIRRYPGAARSLPRRSSTYSRCMRM